MITGLSLGITASNHVEAAASRPAVTVTAYGDAQVDTAQSQFGGASLLLDGTGDYLLTDLEDAADFGSDPFTIECWVRRTSDSGSFEYLANKGWPDSDTNDRSWFFGIGTGDNFVWIYRAGGSNVTKGTPSDFVLNTWHHVAVCNDGTTTRMFFDGTQENSWSTPTINSSTNPVVVGASYDGSTSNFSGNIDEFRVSDTARYTTNFTPSTEPFTNDANTLLLLHMDGTDGSTTFEDDNS